MVSTIAQTVVITITLVVFILQFRSQEKAIKEASYQGLMGRYNDYIRSLIDTPDLARFLVDQADGVISVEEARVYANLLVAYGIIEEAFLLYQKKWIDEATWMQWSAWLRILCDRPQLRRVHERSAGTFDKGFEEYVTHMLKTLDATKVPDKK